MTEMFFDTQKAVDRLVDAGVPPAQARAHAAVLAEVIGSENGHVGEHYATKEDLARVRSDLMNWTLAVAAIAVAIQTALITLLLKFVG